MRAADEAFYAVSLFLLQEIPCSLVDDVNLTDNDDKTTRCSMWFSVGCLKTTRERRKNAYYSRIYLFLENLHHPIRWQWKPERHFPETIARSWAWVVFYVALAWRLRSTLSGHWQVQPLTCWPPTAESWSKGWEGWLNPEWWYTWGRRSWTRRSILWDTIFPVERCQAGGEASGDRTWARWRSGRVDRRASLRILLDFGLAAGEMIFTSGFSVGGSFRSGRWHINKPVEKS